MTNETNNEKADRYIDGLLNIVRHAERLHDSERLISFRAARAREAVRSYSLSDAQLERIPQAEAWARTAEAAITNVESLLYGLEAPDLDDGDAGKEEKEAAFSHLDWLVKQLTLYRTTVVENKLTDNQLATLKRQWGRLMFEAHLFIVAAAQFVEKNKEYPL